MHACSVDKSRSSLTFNPRVHVPGSGQVMGGGVGGQLEGGDVGQGEVVGIYFLYGLYAG